MNDTEQLLLAFLKKCGFGETDSKTQQWSSRSNKHVAAALDEYLLKLQPTHPVPTPVDGKLLRQAVIDFLKTYAEEPDEVENPEYNRLTIYGADGLIEGLQQLFFAHLQAAEDKAFKQGYQTAEDDLASVTADMIRAIEKKLVAEERSHNNTIEQRDNVEEWADKLAYAKYSVEQIGEHSSMNNPWANAFELLEKEASK